MRNDSVSLWIEKLKDGDSEATEYLYTEYFPRLVGLARSILEKRRGFTNDHEDVAMSAFKTFIRRVDTFPQLTERDELWKILLTITLRKAFRHNKKLDREEAPAVDDLMATLRTREPSPEEAAIAVDELETLLTSLPDELSQQIVQARLEGRRQAEIANILECSLSSVERKLKIARDILVDRASGAQL